MKEAMKVVTIGKRLAPADQIAFVEPIDPNADPEFKPEKDFKSRVVLLDRDVVLAERPVQAFAEAHGLHPFEDNVAIHEAVAETFEPSESFKPAKPCQTRLKWYDAANAEQSKLLPLTPETVIAEILDVKVQTPAPSKRAIRRPGRDRRGHRVWRD